MIQQKLLIILTKFVTFIQRGGGGGITLLLYAPVLGLEGLDNPPHPTPNKMQEPLRGMAQSS
jgi:hypothetical protein